MTDKWFVAPSLNTLLHEINTRWPLRSTLSDGALGNARHQKLVSDHNPDWYGVDPGVVRARDFTVIDINTLQVQIDPDLVLKHVIGDRRVNYVIWDKYIYRRRTGWVKEPYWLVNPAGFKANPHTHHIHVSLLHTRQADSDTSPWGVLPPPVPPVVQVTPVFPEDEDMKLVVQTPGDVIWLVSGNGRLHLKNPNTIDEWRALLGIAPEAPLHKMSGEALIDVPEIGEAPNISNAG